MVLKQILPTLFWFEGHLATISDEIIESIIRPIVNPANKISYSGQHVKLEEQALRSARMALDILIFYARDPRDLMRISLYSHWSIDKSGLVQLVH